MIEYWVMFLGSEFLAVLFAHAIGMISPGPDFALVTKNTLVYDRSTGMYSALGIALGISIHMMYCVAGLGLVISQSHFALVLMKYLGACYLTFIGLQSIRSSFRLKTVLKSMDMNKPDPVTRIQNMSSLAAFRMGFLTNILNPKCSLFFISIFSQVVSPNTPKMTLITYCAAILVISVAWFCFLAYAFSQKIVRSRINTVEYYIERGMGVFFVLLGLKLAFSPII